MRMKSTDPSTLSPHQRLLELAAILARAVHRIRDQAQLSPSTGQNLPISGGSGLELSATSGPDGQCEPES